MSAHRNEDLVETRLFYHRETERAVRVSVSNQDESGFWLPKSQIDVKKIAGGRITFEWPYWLAESRGLI